MSVRMRRNQATLPWLLGDQVDNGADETKRRGPQSRHS